MIARDAISLEGTNRYRLGGLGSGSRRGSHGTIFEYEGASGLRVFLAGTFNRWQPNVELTEIGNSGRYTATMLLEPGRHEYKLIVNGEWIVDPFCDRWTINQQGTLNSILEF